MTSLSQCQESCEDPAALARYSSAVWSLVLSIPEYASKWNDIKALLGGGAELRSLADLSAVQVRQLFEKLGIESASPFANAQMQGIYADSFYDEDPDESPDSQEGGTDGTDGNKWSEALTWISDLTEVQEDAIDDEIDVCYEACSESHLMVFSFDGATENFPEFDMWVSSILRQGVDIKQPAVTLDHVTRALEEEFRQPDDDFSGSSDPHLPIEYVDIDPSSHTSSAPYGLSDLATVINPKTADGFFNLLQSHMPVPALQDQVVVFADSVALNNEVGVYVRERS